MGMDVARTALSKEILPVQQENRPSAPLCVETGTMPQPTRTVMTGTWHQEMGAMLTALLKPSGFAILLLGIRAFVCLLVEMANTPLRMESPVTMGTW